LYLKRERLPGVLEGNPLWSKRAFGLDSIDESLRGDHLNIFLTRKNHTAFTQCLASSAHNPLTTPLIKTKTPPLATPDHDNSLLSFILALKTDKPSSPQQSTQASAPQSSATPAPAVDQDAADAHEKVYQQGNSAAATDEELGKAAAVEAFKEYEKDEKSERSEGEGGQSKLIAMVMEKVQGLISGRGEEGQKTALQSALAMAMKLLASKSGGSGEGAGGLGSLMSNPQVAQALQNPQVQGLFKKFM